MLDLGLIAISDFPEPGGAEDSAPLELVHCSNCGLIQLKHTVDRDRLYKFYYYRSGINESMVQALKEIVDYAQTFVKLEPNDKVLDIGANDGTLLSFYPRYVWAHGFEPASNLAEEAMQKAHARIFSTYFPPSFYIDNKYRIITSIAQFYNVHNPNKYLRTIKAILAPDGVWVVQFQNLEAMLACNGFDNLCHEHLLYLSRNVFRRFIGRYGLHVIEETYNSINGGSVRYVVAHGPKKTNTVDGIDSSEAIYQFANRVKTLREDTIRLLSELKETGKVVLGMGASTKFNTLAQYYGIGPNLIAAIGERNQDKLGRVTVATHIPIVDEYDILRTYPDYIVVGPWQFFDSFRQRYSSYKGKWIRLLPELSVVDGG